MWLENCEIWGKHHHVHCYNYFTSVNLFQELLDNETYACGTILTNRKGLPPALAKAKLKKPRGNGPTAEPFYGCYCLA